MKFYLKMKTKCSYERKALCLNKTPPPTQKLIFFTENCVAFVRLALEKLTEILRVKIMLARMFFVRFGSTLFYSMCIREATPRVPRKTSDVIQWWWWWWWWLCSRCVPFCLFVCDGEKHPAHKTHIKILERVTTQSAVRHDKLVQKLAHFVVVVVEWHFFNSNPDETKKTTKGKKEKLTKRHPCWLFEFPWNPCSFCRCE